MSALYALALLLSLALAIYLIAALLYPERFE
ncbi:MAG TPA: K(+)-transporting ATPase subunit F [Thermoanaerobaculia bacterium]|nr:K(+)-transporting ATPase subunit F [Thermoanaerobaculia bacterium]